VPDPSATLADFAQINDTAAATTKKLQKQHILAGYLHALAEADLSVAVRFTAGRPFAANDERVLGVSGAIVSDVLVTLLQIDPGEFHATAIRSGEIGEALSTLWPSTPETEPTLTLKTIESAFFDLSQTGNVENKKQILRDLFRQCTTGREAAYLAKIIFSDLRTGIKEGVLQAATAEAFNKTTAQIQRCDLLVGDLGEVALLAKQNCLESATFRLFHPIQFMLATPQETPEKAAATIDGRPFFAEHKLDGIRAHIHKSGEGRDARVAIYSRTLDRTDESFPDIVSAISALPGEFLLDGEIVPFQNGQVLPFAHIQKRLGRKVLSPKILRDHPAVFIAFDLLYLNGQLLMDRPLRQRRQMLADLPASLQKTESIELTTAAEIESAFCNARECRNEGLVLKDPDSIYSPGRRGQLWLKLKTHLPTLDCVVTAAEYGHGKRRGVLSDYTFAIWNRDPPSNPADPAAELVNIGKAFSGVTDEEIAQLTELFLGISLAQRGRVHAVPPKIVLEIAFDQIQRSARHASGFALRFPRIKRIRWDKSPTDADTLPRVEEIFKSASNTAHLHEAASDPEPTLFDGLP
jgi:DNA ligase 1